MPDSPPAKDASKKASPKPSLRGKRLGRYALQEHLASGGMAEIYLARQDTDGFAKQLVLKVLQERYADNPQVVEMFRQEARLGAELRHPSIVDVYDIGEDDGVRYIAMEYIEGKTLTELVLRALEVSRPLPLPLAAYIVAQVAEGLAYLQGDGGGRPRQVEIVHRDISPPNLVVGFSGQTKIIDFGVAHRARQEEAGDGARPGKVAYMSPEQVKGQPLDGRSDVFSLGTILYEITLGKRLWRGPAEVVMKRLVEERHPPPTSIQRDYPPALELIVQKALEKRPEDRYQSAAAMAEDLETYLASMGERVNNRHVAQFLREIFAPDAKVSEGGARRARAFEDDDGLVMGMNDADVIDFDRPRSAPGAAFAQALREAAPTEVVSASAAAFPTPAAPAPVVAPSPPAPAGVAAAAVLPPAAPSPRRLLWVVGVAAIAVGLAALFFGR